MINTNSLGILGQFYLNIKDTFKSIYQNSNFYEKKISKTSVNSFEYKPSPHLLSSIINYQNKKYKIEDFTLDSIWQKKMSLKDFEKLNNFFWFFSIDLKSSKKSTQKIIKNWILNNRKFNNKSWELDLTAKRIISWLSNHQLTYEDSDEDYRLTFDHMIQKQANHLLNEIDVSKETENKIVRCAAIILTGLAYKKKGKYLDSGLNQLKNMIKHLFDNQGFPKSRNIKQLIIYLKYFIIIREWFKESQNIIPDYIDETIFYLGTSYAFIWQNIKHDILFNGNYSSKNSEFDQYLKRFGYSFKSETQELSGYVILKNKKIILSADVGPNPNKLFSSNYQAGALSFEIFSNGKKLISNAGYFSKKKNKLNKLSRSTAMHSTLVIEDQSSCKFTKQNTEIIIDKGLKILKKNIIFEANYWKISGAHDGYAQQFGLHHEREIEFYPEKFKFIGYDKLLKKNSNREIKFDIRFHLDPTSKVMKTQDNKSILIELEEEGWKFNCEDFDINIENSLYFGDKNLYKDNQSIIISGINNQEVQIIKWEINKL